MSYDVQIWSVRPFVSSALPHPEEWHQPVRTQWIRLGRNWQLSIFDSSRVLLEDVPEEIAHLLPGIQSLTELHLEGNATSGAMQLLRSVSHAVARVLHGVIFDPQEDLIRTPSGVRRFVKPEKQETFSALRLSWWFLGSPLLSRSGRGALLSLLERFLPEAMPRRYGLWEPPQHTYAETGREHLLQFLDQNAHTMTVWYPHRPVFSVHLGQPENVGASRLGFRTNIFEIEIDSCVLNQPGWPENLREFWRRVSHMLKPIYGEIRWVHGLVRSGGSVFVTSDESPDLTKSWWWRGVPKHLGCAVVLGSEYQKLWPNFRSYSSTENDLAFAELPDWRAHEDLSLKIGAPPLEIVQPISVGVPRDERYPEAWPFGEPFDPPRAESGKP